MESKNWVFTCNNYNESHGDSLSKLDTKYYVFGKEVGDSGTPHMQGYFILNKNMRLSPLSKKLPGFHLEVRKGSHDQARDYCIKDGDFMEEGTPPVSKRKLGEMEKDRWAKAKRSAIDGNFEEVPDDIYWKYYKTMKEIHKDNMVKPDGLDGVCGTWYYGESGVGKSRTAREDFPDAYDKPANKWWDGYQLEENVLIDDLDKNHGVLSHHLKIWADRYAFIAEVKGGALSIRPTHIVVTSQYKIEDIWEDDSTREALNRRFKKIHVTKIKKNDI